MLEVLRFKTEPVVEAAALAAVDLLRWRLEQSSINLGKEAGKEAKMEKEKEKVMARKAANGKVKTAVKVTQAKAVGEISHATDAVSQVTSAVNAGQT